MYENKTLLRYIYIILSNNVIIIYINNIINNINNIYE